MKKNEKDLLKAYVSPEVEMIDICVETCFALSGEMGIDDMVEEGLEW